MVGPALQRATSSEDLAQEEQHVEKHRWQASPRLTSHQNSHVRQQYSKQCPGSDSGKRSGQRGPKVTDHRVGGAPDMSGRVNLPSLASSSGRSTPHSNLDRFLDVTTPTVNSQTLRKSCLRDSSQKRCFNPEVTPYFNLGDLWDSFDEWSAYGAGVPLVLNGDETVVQYYVPYLSALQLYTLPSRRPDQPVGYRHLGSESDEGSEASSDGENERLTVHGRSFRGRDYKGAESPPPNLGGSLGSSSRLECSTFTTADEEGEVWSYFEHSQPYCRVPFVDKIGDLSRDFKPEYNPLRNLRSVDLLPNSWLSVAWYPIYRIPTGPTLRDLAACFLTYYPLSTPLQRESVSPLDSQSLSLQAFGLASYKLRGGVWTSSPRQATSLQNEAADHLKRLHVEHPDFKFFTSHGTLARR